MAPRKWNGLELMLFNAESSLVFNMEGRLITAQEEMRCGKGCFQNKTGPQKNTEISQPQTV